MDRYIGLDAHASSCTLAVVGPSGKRLGSLVVRTADRVGNVAPGVSVTWAIVTFGDAGQRLDSLPGRLVDPPIQNDGATEMRNDEDGLLRSGGGGLLRRRQHARDGEREK